jgi:hypothetical protein
MYKPLYFLDLFVWFSLYLLYLCSAKYLMDKLLSFAQQSLFMTNSKLVTAKSSKSITWKFGQKLAKIAIQISVQSHLLRP